MSPLVPNGTLAVAPADVERLETACGSLRPAVALILGSGLGGALKYTGAVSELAFGELDGWPSAESASVPGHRGRIVLGNIVDTGVMVFDGRLHTYQGLSARDAAYPVRLAAALGIDTIVVTNASGGISPQMQPGMLVLLADQMNLTGDNPLAGWVGPVGGTPFVPMTDAFDPRLRATASQAAADLQIDLRSGVYCGVSGPNYETPAEAAMLRVLGADAVGMSTVAEVIVARALQMRVLGLSLVTNRAGAAGLDHAEVLGASRIAAERMQALLLAILQRLQ